MTSKDDDTLPLPGFSEELTPDVTIDEDFIPTSQPQSITGSKVSKNSDTSLDNSSEELISHSASTSRIDDTLPREAVIDQSTFDNNKSADFIPDTETKKMKITYANEGLSCKKKLAVLDAFGITENPAWDDDISRISESPALDTQNLSILKESPTEENTSKQETVKREDSLTVILVNDSAETVDLEKVEKEDDNSSLDVDRCRDTQIFDSSSILFLDQPEPSGLSCRNYEKDSEVIEQSYLQETVEDNKENSQDKANALVVNSSPAPVTDDHSRRLDSIKPETVNVPTSQKSAPQSAAAEQSTKKPIHTPMIRIMDFKLKGKFLISVNPKSKEILDKAILNVVGTIAAKPKPTNFMKPPDNPIEKSKRLSSSSSGSVYSDKSELPFALPKRLSTISDQTDSSEDDVAVLRQNALKNELRTPWANEYLFSLAMDDIIHGVIEKEDFLKSAVMSSPRKSKSNPSQGKKQLKEILESSSSSIGDSPIGKAMKVNNSEEMESSENLVLEAEKTGESIKDNVENKTDSSVGRENVQSSEKEERSSNEPQPEPERQIVEQTRIEEQTNSVSLSSDLPVFARWTDKRYYSGVLCGDVKNDRWDVKFDDGTSKAVREDFIMPTDWLKVGALVFALVGDKYVSGQIIDIKRENEVQYIVELDTEKKEVSVKITDLCLTDVMAGIVREKYKPLSGTPRGRAEIDFDNVLSGKRLREQRTPLRPSVSIGPGSSSGLKKKSSKTKKDEGQRLQSIKETPPNKDPEVAIRALKTDNGHLVEDKIISTESPSGNDTVETPLRKVSKEPKRKAKPRSLSYETEENRSGKETSWLAPDGTPIPGPSGVKSKRQNNKSKAEEPLKSHSDKNEPMGTRSTKRSPAKAIETSEKSKRKRKLDESSEDSITQKKPLKEGKSRVKTRSRKG